jgi:WD40 repeat protein
MYSFIVDIKSYFRHFSGFKFSLLPSIPTRLPGTQNVGQPVLQIAFNNCQKEAKMSRIPRAFYVLLITLVILLTSCSPKAKPGKTVFIGYEGEIARLDIKLGQVRSLHQTGGGVIPSPDYSKLIFIDWNNESENFHTLYLMDSNGKNRKTLLGPEDTAKMEDWPWPPYYWLDNKSILIAIRGNSGFGSGNLRQIYTMNTETGEYKNIFSDIFGNLFVSPDGKTLIIEGVFRLLEGDAKDVILNIDGSGERDFAHFPDKNEYPAEVVWLSQPNKVAVIVSDWLIVERYIAIVDLETQEVVNLIPKQNASINSISLSPDGKYLTFAFAIRGETGSFYAERHDIHVLNLADSSMKNLTNSAEADDKYPSWVKDNQILYFTEDQNTCAWNLIDLMEDTPKTLHSYACEN